MLLTLYTIATFMNRDGYAFPGQQEIANGARASVRTVRRHIADAERAGWLAVELAGRSGQGWRHNAYRARVPDALTLDNLDETIADAIVSQAVDVVERADRVVSHPHANGKDTMLSSRHVERADTIASAASTQREEGEDIRCANERTSEAGGEDTGCEDVRTQSCPTNSRSETLALRTHASEKAHSAGAVRATLSDRASAAPESQKRRSPEQDDAARHRILRLATVQSDLPDTDIARICRASVELVREVRGSMEVQP